MFRLFRLAVIIITKLKKWTSTKLVTLCKWLVLCPELLLFLRRPLGWPHFQSFSEGASKCLCRAESGGGGGDDGAPEIRCLWWPAIFFSYKVKKINKCFSFLILFLRVGSSVWARRDNQRYLSVSPPFFCWLPGSSHLLLRAAYFILSFISFFRTDWKVFPRR